MGKLIMEQYRTRILAPVQATGTAAAAYAALTPGSSMAVLRCLVTMGNAADLVLTPKYADDASGTGATGLAGNVPIFVDGVRKTDAKAYTVGDEEGNFIVDFVIDPKAIPDGKTIGITYADSHASNLMACELIETVAYRPTAS